MEGLEMEIGVASSRSGGAVRLWPIEAVIFCLIAATLAPLVMGYSFGEDDQIEQLPLLYRALDPSYCVNDFFLNASGEFNPRIYYSWFLAALARHLPVPWIFLGLTWVTNV